MANTNKKHKGFEKWLHTSEKPIHPWHVGLMIALYNSLIMVVFGIFLALTIKNVSVSLYAFFVMPVVYVLFWLWVSQAALRYYKKLKWHDILLVAKASIFPFMVSFLVCTFVYWYLLYRPIADKWIVDAYFGMLSSIGLIFAGIAVIGFGLSHRIDIKTITRRPKKKK